MNWPIPGWSPSTPEVCPSLIEDAARRRQAVAIHFWAPWNAHDVPMDRDIQAISAGFEGRVVFASANVDRDENAELFRRCGVGNIPALGILVDGEPRRAVIGAREPESLAAEIEVRLHEPPPLRRRRWPFRGRRPT